MSGRVLSGCPKEECRNYTLLVMIGCRSVVALAVMFSFFAMCKPKAQMNMMHTITHNE